MSSFSNTESGMESVHAALDAWARAFSEEDPSPLLSLYADDAVLWGTFSSTRRQGHAAILDYFEQVFAFQHRSAEVLDPLIRIFGSSAVNTGSYVFSFMRDGKMMTVPARYSFVYLNRNGKWLIVDHHSSTMPSTVPSPGAD